jgi:hypothetical protein
MARKGFISFPAFAAALLGGCAPTPLLRYASDDPADRWKSGVRLHSARTEEASFISAFVGETTGQVPDGAAPGRYGRAITISLLARNESASDLRLEPADFRMLAARSGKAYTPVDPESAIVVLDRIRQTEIQRASDETAFRGILALPLLAGEVASLWGSPRDRDEASKALAESERADAEEKARHQEAMAEIDGGYRRWTEEALRRTDLAAGKSLSGDLTFVFPEGDLPPDTLMLEWTPAGGRPHDLGRYGRPRIAADTVPTGKMPGRPENGRFVR